MKPKQSPEFLSRAPAYLNGSLSLEERQAFEQQLQQNPPDQPGLEDWRLVQQAVQSQPLYASPVEVERRIMAAIHRNKLQARNSFPASLLASFGLVICILALLWGAVRPGVVLAWSGEDSRLASYRVYRAPLGSQDFSLVSEVPAQPGVAEYTFVDPLLLPGQAYSYRVEGIGSTGQAAVSAPVEGRGSDALPGQAALLAASLVISAALLEIRKRRYQFC